MLCNNCGTLVSELATVCYHCRENIINGKANPIIKILLVEDDESLIEMVQKWLNLAGLKTTLTMDGSEALKVFRDNYFDLVILDIDLPIIDGITISKIIKERNPKLPVILCSGYTESITPEKIAESKADSFITKPMNLDFLLSEIQRLTFNGVEQDF